MQVSTVPTVKSQLVTKITTKLATASLGGGQVQVSWAWPGAATEAESVFLGFHPGLRDVLIDVDHQDPTIKAGRRQRQESYEVPVTVWSFRSSLTADDAETAEKRAFALADPIEDLFADDPRIGLAATVVQRIFVDGIESTLVPFEKGWACALVMTVAVQARLT